MSDTRRSAWTWDDNKNRINKQKHGLGFETAKLVFDDLDAVFRLDDGSDEERWHTVGAVGAAIVMVVHTWPEPERGTNVAVGRIISARRATARERAAYEEGEFYF